MTNLKRYNIFVFITSFAKLMVELFIPLMLYNKGFSVKDIILFIIIKYIFCVLFIPIGRALGNKYGFDKLMILSSFMFCLTYLYLNFISLSISCLIILALLFSSYLMFYWLGRHIYALSIIEDKKTTDNVGLYSIFTILGGLFATYIGAFVLEKFGFVILSIIVLILMIVSVIPLFKIKDVKFIDTIKLINVFKSFSKKNLIFTAVDQFRYVACTIFPLYVYLYIKKDFSYLGVVNIICGIGSIIYIYFLSKKMDKDKKDYLSASLLLVGLVFLIKLFISTPSLFLIVIFFEGIIKSSVDVITTRNTYCYGKNYEEVVYICFIELINNIFRTIILLLFYIFNFNLVYSLLICILGIFISVFIKYDDGKYGYSRLIKKC